MNWVDLAIIAIIAWSAFRAFRTGLVRELTSLIAVIAGVFLAGALSERLSANLDFLISDAPTRNLVAFIAIFVGVLIAGQVLSAFLSDVAGMLLLGPLDHIAGAIFGLLQGILIVQMLLIGLAVFPAAASVSSAVDDSTLADVFLDTLPSVDRLLPERFRDPMDQLQKWREITSRLQPIPTQEAILPGLPKGVGTPTPAATATPAGQPR
ncbi:MAG: CvpA family protein [Dehalococcoidia bacterium]|nr:MAG: CvpA family protein [Dehalococcoidia bacterium]